MSFDAPACHACGAELPSDPNNTVTIGVCAACGATSVANPEESRRYIHKARNSGNAAEAYHCCREALAMDPGNAVAWAERFRVSFWLNSELKGNMAKTIIPEEQLSFLEEALKASDEDAQMEVARVIIRFYVSEFAIDQHIRLAPTEAPQYLARFQRFMQALAPAMQTRLKEELIYLTGEALNKSLSANCRTNHRRQNFLNLCACLTLPVSRHASPLYIRIYETLEGQPDTDENTQRTGFLCLVSSNRPEASKENIRQAHQRTTPDYEIGDWPLGVQIASTRTPEKLLSIWLVQWVFAYQEFLGIDPNGITQDTYECLGSPTELAAALEAFSHAIAVSYST